MPKFVASPIIVEAYSNDGTAEDWPKPFFDRILSPLNAGGLEIKTGDGPRVCAFGDYVLRDGSGEFSIIRKNLFENMFKPFRPPEQQVVHGQHKKAHHS